MRYRTQAVAYPYFVVAMLFYGLQMAFGLLAAVKYLGPDPIKGWLPFDVTKEIHTNLLIVWVLTGFMGAAYWLVPEESRTELHSPTARVRCARLVDARWAYRRDRLPVRLDGGQQAARAATAREARHRRRDADVPVQPRHDDLDGEAPDHDGGSADGRADMTALLYLPSLFEFRTTRSRSSIAGGRCISGSRGCGKWSRERCWPTC